MNKQIPSLNYSVHSWIKFVQVSLSLLACCLTAIAHAADPSKGLVDLFADLSVVVSSPPSSVVSNEVTYTITVSNAGPQSASGVTLVDTLPIDLQVTSTNGCTLVAGVLTCNLGTIASGDTAVRTIKVRPILTGVLANVATVTGLSVDLNLLNNVVTNLLNILPPLNVPPVALCKPLTLSLAAGCTTTLTPADVDAGSFDADGTITNRTIDPPGPYGPGVTLVTLTVTDDKGASSSCISAVTVLDVLNPVLNCLTNIVQAVLPNECSSVITYALPQATDNCPGSLLISCNPPSGSAFPIGNTTVNCTARDLATNVSLCAFVVSVLDNLKPTLNCPLDILTNVAPGGSNRVVAYAAGAVDNCTVSSVVCVPPSGSLFTVGTTPVTCTATDSAGNTNICGFIVRVLSSLTNIPPVVQSHDITINAVADCQVSVSAAAVDNGSYDPDSAVVTLTLNPPGPFSIGTNEVILTAVDNSGASNSSTARVIVVDTIPPVFNSVPDVDVVAAAGETSVNVSFANPTANDACSSTVTCSPPSGSSFAIGTSTVTCTATDDSGNSTTYSFAVNVQDESLAGVRDLAVTKIKAPRLIDISGLSSLTRRVCVTIQNRSRQVEVITNYTQLAELVTLEVHSLDSNACPGLTPVMLETRPQRKLPFKLKPKRKLKVFFEVTFNCSANLEKGAGKEDFQYIAEVHHEALDGHPDAHPDCNVCPRGPQPNNRDPNPNGKILDKGCGAPAGRGAFGNPVVTDLFMK